MKKEIKTPITHDALIKAGFVENRNMYMKDGCDVMLIKGHTWVFSSKNIGEKDLAGMVHLSELVQQSKDQIKFATELEKGLGKEVWTGISCSCTRESK